MNKLTLLILAFCILSLTNVTGAYAASKVDVVVAGDINHGPMQPTINAIKEVTGKYGDQVSVTWIDLNTAEGAKYFREHGLSAHLNVLVNGHYQFLLNGRKVTFQWFEGAQWKKSDLDAVISGLLNNNPNVTPLENARGENSLFGIVMGTVYSIVLRPSTIIGVAIVLVAVFYLVRRSRKKRKAERNGGKV